MKNNHATEIIDLTARVFQRSCALLAAVELDIFNAISNGFNTPESIAKKYRMNQRGCRMLLRALAAMGFLNKSGENYFINDISKPLAGKDSALKRKSLMHVASGLRRWVFLAEAVKKGRIREKFLAWGKEKESRDFFISAMEISSRKRASSLVKAVKPIIKKCKNIVDLGCGSGGYSRAFLEINPYLQVTLFESPEVMPLTMKYMKPFLKSSRVKFIAGDFLKDDFGSGYDGALLSSIIHIYSPSDAIKILKSVYDSLDFGGWIIIQDFILDDSEVKPVNAALFGLHMLVSTNSGGTYTRREYKEWLSNAGFRCISFKSLKESCIVVGKKV